MRQNYAISQFGHSQYGSDLERRVYDYLINLCQQELDHLITYSI